MRWRAEFDKKRREQVVPIPEALAGGLEGARLRLAAVGDGWVFIRVHKDAPWAPAQCQDLLRRKLLRRWRSSREGSGTPIGGH
jgi:hypothetical protein